jgi:hypothetical protein
VASLALYLAIVSYLGYVLTVACCLKNGRKVSKLVRTWLELAQYGSNTSGGNGSRHLRDLFNALLTIAGPITWTVMEAYFTKKSAIILVSYAAAIWNC